MDIDDFDYDLPEELIAQKLADPRDSARLMILEDDIVHRKFSDLAGYLDSGDVLVMNSTKVMETKLLGKKSTGSDAEVVLTKKIKDDGKSSEWECRIKTKNPRAGSKILFDKGSGDIIQKLSIDLFVIRLSSNDILKDAILPTPPYIERKLSADEYQTVFAETEGSLAAPTAGLHFTKDLLEMIRKKGVKIIFITLHVSYGTFKNIDDGIENYVMDPEYYCISQDAADSINNRKGKLVVVGTTTLKALESSSKDGMITASCGDSRLFIVPGHKFNSGTDCLVTNFHLPKSTLLLLTCAYGGKERILDAYKTAVKEKYHFFSLGDAMMIYR